MQKAALLTAYKINDGKYKDACTVLGLEPVETFPSAKIDDFEQVIDWLNGGGLNVKSAIARYQELVTSRQSPDSIDGALDLELSSRDDQIEELVWNLREETDSILEGLPAQYRVQLFSRISGAFRKIRDEKPQRPYPKMLGVEPVIDAVALPEGKEG
jgi:hypothetical protein